MLLGKTMNKTKDQKVFERIQVEITKARTKFPNNEDLIVALQEEVGELSQALLEIKHEPHKQTTMEDVLSEAVQVAAVAIRIATEGDANFPQFNPDVILDTKD